MLFCVLSIRTRWVQILHKSRPTITLHIRRWAPYGYHTPPPPPHLNKTKFFEALGYTEHEI